VTREGDVLTLTDCPLDPIAGWTLAVVGYGNQGAAQAQNLRDSGFRVVGGDPERPSARRAQADGFGILPLGAVVSQAELILLTVPDELHREVVGVLLGGRTTSMRTCAWVLAHGFSLVHDPPPIPRDHDVFVVAPAGPGVQVRSRFVEGNGVPALLAVHQDASGQADPRARAYAAGIGAARAGLLRSTVRDEVDIDLFGEQAVLCGGMNALTQAAFDTLVNAGYSPEASYLECVHQLRLTAELVEKYGIEGMRRRISTTALFGDLTRGPRIGGPELRSAMDGILDDVRSGRFAREWLETRNRETGWAREAPEVARHDLLEAAGETIRGLFRPLPQAEKD